MTQHPRANPAWRVATIAALLVGTQAWASDMVRPVRVLSTVQKAQIEKLQREGVDAMAPVAPAPPPPPPTYTKDEIDAAVSLAKAVDEYNKKSAVQQPITQDLAAKLAYKKQQDDAFVQAAAKAATDKAVVEAVQVANGGDPKCNVLAKDPNKDPCNQLGATSKVAPELGLTTAKSSTTASIKLIKAYVNTGGDTYRPLWVGATLPVNGPIKKDGVVQALLNPDAGLINVSTTPLKADNGEYIHAFRHEKDGVCGFKGMPENGCFGFVKMGLKAIQAPINEKNDYVRPLMAYVTAGAYVNFPLYGTRDRTEPTVGNLALGLSGMYGWVNAKKLDYVFGERISNSIGAVNAEASFKLNDVVSASYSGTVKSTPKQIGRTHAFTITMLNK